VLTGLVLTLIAGTLGGSVLAPLKRMRRWPFANSWAIYSVWAYLIMPWLVAWLTIPDLASIYPQVSIHSKLICGAAGLGWGFAVVLFGVAVNLAGLTLASAIIYGASVAVGSLAPLIISHASILISPQGWGILAGNAVMIAGIVLCALAGRSRDYAKGTPAAARNFSRGLAASCAAAVLSSLFNIALAYGGEFDRLAIAHGANRLNASNAQWAYTVTFGYLPNLAVSLIVLSRAKTWSVYRSKTLSHWLWPPVMGAMWIGGTALYGSATNALGALGPVIGWPIYMSVMIISGSAWGWITGEWADAPGKAMRLLGGGIAVQALAMAILSMMNR